MRVTALELEAYACTDMATADMLAQGAESRSQHLLQLLKINNTSQPSMIFN